MQRPNRVMNLIEVVWPRIWGVQTIYPANMDVPYAMARPILAAEIRSPVRFPGPKPQLTRSLISPQTVLRGVPFFDAIAANDARLAQLDMTRQSGPRAPTGTKI